MPTPTGTIPDGLGVLGLYLGVTEADAFLFLTQSTGTANQLDTYLRYQDGSSVPLFSTNTKSIRDGVATPTYDIGADGDFYIQYGETPTFYGPKSSGSWGVGIPLIGPQGKQGVPAEGSELVINTTTSTFDAVNGARHIAYNPLNLSIPAGYISGFEGYLESRTPGTVKLAVPSGFQVTYANLPYNMTGRPVLNSRTGVLYYNITSLGQMSISGDYVYTNKSWHPTDAGDALIAYWEAGPSTDVGGHTWHPIEFNDIPFTNQQAIRWEAKFGSLKNARLVYEPLLNGEGGTDLATFAPKLTGDTSFKNSYGYNLRLPAGANRPMRFKNHTGDAFPSAPCRIFMAVRHLSTTEGTQQVFSIDSGIAYAAGSNNDGLHWINAFYGYQFTTKNTSGSYGTKGAFDENVTTPQLITVAISGNGSATIYSDQNIITGPMPSTSISFSRLEFNCGMPMNLGGLAIITGASTNISQEIDTMKQLFFSGNQPMS